MRQAFFFGLLTICLLFFLFVTGFPALIRLITLIGEKRAGEQGVEKTDLFAPAPPTLYSPFEATNSAVVSLSGFAETDVKVKIVLNGKVVKEVNADDEGEFKVKNISLEKGKNRFKARAIDEADNESDFSKEIVVLLDTEPPELELLSPKNGDSFFDKDREIKIEGNTDKESRVFLNERFVTVNGQGNFSTTLELKEGENKLKLKAQDLAGNSTKIEISVNYTP